MSDNVHNIEVARIAAEEPAAVGFDGLSAWVNEEGCVTAVKLRDYVWDERRVFSDAEAKRAILVSVYEWVKQDDADWLGEWVRGKVQP